MSAVVKQEFFQKDSPLTLGSNDHPAVEYRVRSPTDLRSRVSGDLSAAPNANRPLSLFFWCDEDRFLGEYSSQRKLIRLALTVPTGRDCVRPRTAGTANAGLAVLAGVERRPKNR